MTTLTEPATAATTAVDDLSFGAVRRAAEIVGAHLGSTPALRHPLLDALVGSEIVVKHDHVLPTGSFKVRGGIHLAAGLTPGVRLVTCSTGNHAQSVAYAARLAGVGATVVMPASAPAVKREAVRALGAEVVVLDGSLSDAAARARELAVAPGTRYVDPTDPAIILGHATLYLELFAAHSDLEVVYVPIGSGTGAAGACLVRDTLAPRCRVVGVQSSSAPAGYRSWLAGTTVTAPSTTRVSGLATSTGYLVPQGVLASGLADFVLVSDDDITVAARLLAARAHTLVEGAGAAGLAALLADPARPRRCGVVLTGANACPEEIAALAG